MMHDKATSSYSWQEMMQTRATHQDKFKWPGTTYNNSGKSSYAYLEIGPDLNKPYVQVVKQQVKMHQDDLHEILVKLNIKFI